MPRLKANSMAPEVEAFAKIWHLLHKNIPVIGWAVSIWIIGSSDSCWICSQDWQNNCLPLHLAIPSPLSDRVGYVTVPQIPRVFWVVCLSPLLWMGYEYLVMPCKSIDDYALHYRTGILNMEPSRRTSSMELFRGRKRDYHKGFVTVQQVQHGPPPHSTCSYWCSSRLSASTSNAMEHTPRCLSGTPTRVFGITATRWYYSLPPSKFLNVGEGHSWMTV
jgi:hypothetical protein